MAIYKLENNRVWRTYLGGQKLSEMYSGENILDSQYPETWIASVTEARNPTYLEGEGLSYVEGTDTTLLDLINRNPEEMLGKNHVKNHGVSTGILVKFLDAAERLTIQVHPSKENARKLFASEFGKTEAWYIMGGRDIDGQAPCIYFGFKEYVTKELWVELFNKQDIQGMLDCLHKIYVKEGEVYLIEGGNPHAIGAGCFILEIQEPTDYTIRVERTTPNNYEIPDNLCHQGLGFDLMHDCFDFTGYKKEDVLDKWRLSESGDNKTSLISYTDTNCFSLERYKTFNQKIIETIDSFSVLVVTSGSGEINCDEQIISVKAGDQFFVSASTSNITCKSIDSGQLEIIRCLPPK